MTRIGKYFFLCILISLYIKSIHAATPTESAKQITSILSQSGTEVKNSVSFYNKGVDCHQRKLTSIAYYSQKDGVFFFFNDALKNCYFAFVPMPPPGQTMTTLRSCIISDTQANKLFTAWYLDGLKNYDATHKLNEPAQKFVMEIMECLKPITGDELISLLPNSTT